MRRLILFSCLALMGCPPDDPDGIPGALGKIYFSDLARRPLAAGGATTLISVVSTGGYTLESSDPSVFEATVTGDITTREPGTANLVAKKNGQTIDYIALTVVRVAAIGVNDAEPGFDTKLAAVVVGFPRVFYTTLLGPAGESLAGDLDVTISVDGVLAPVAVNDGLYDGYPNIGVAGKQPGEGRVIARLGSLEATRTVRVVSESDLDEIGLLSLGNSGGSADGSIAARVTLIARIAGEDVGGATCDWEVGEGVMIGLDNVQPDGSLLTDFWTLKDRISPVCRIGNLAKTIEIIPSKLR